MSFTHKILRRKVLADTLTPVAIYQRLGQQPYSYLLESVEGGERWARFSVVGLPAAERIVAKDGKVEHWKGEQCIESVETNPLDYLEAFHASRKVADIPEDLPFAGGLVGYFGYDCIGYIEQRLAKRPAHDVVNIPDVLFCLSEAVVVMDNLRGEANLLVTADLSSPQGLEKAEQRLEEMEKALFAPQQIEALHLAAPDVSKFCPEYEMGEVGYKSAVEKIKEYVVAGDVMQVVPSQRMSVSYTRPALDLYRALRITNPSPYMYLLDMGNHQIVGSSPEILARVEQKTVTVRPIAGTRRRGQTLEEDLALEKELLADEKELAEHTMLIDLGRNDIGRVCEIGTVKVTKKMAIERYSHVMHIVSNVEGKLADNKTAIDVFKATFPAGTLSGASKVRAMEVIDELETSRRGIYGGAVGYWSWKGNMDLAIAIRTGLIKDEKLYVQAGGGIVYDSKPEDEWQETLNKLGALIKAASMLN
ncbi:anthranilate synthase component I [Suttonella ornithocola]|uniref:Anthranilate synthase component 1 n=1 Tax=Suttonella ornithocola TaxID=279832 RepID=A0A380MSF8_9GAMM|nr:anthranilate synthase component I [Suttonella ornithocola]SUO94996.1 Anthranilate synthase component 1 [Suttonella ornithocola]